MKFKPATESEKVVLGALILDPELFSVVQNILCSADFHYPVHKEIYDCMHKLYLKYGTFDIAMILDNLETNAVYLYELSNECASTRNIEAHATIIREKSVQKHLIQCAEALHEKECLHHYEIIYKCSICGEKKDMNTSLANLHARE